MQDKVQRTSLLLLQSALLCGLVVTLWISSAMNWNGSAWGGDEWSATAGGIGIALFVALIANVLAVWQTLATKGPTWLLLSIGVVAIAVCTVLSFKLTPMASQPTAQLTWTIAWGSSACLALHAVSLGRLVWSGQKATPAGVN